MPACVQGMPACARVLGAGAVCSPRMSRQDVQRYTMVGGGWFLYHRSSPRVRCMPHTQISCPGVAVGVRQPGQRLTTGLYCTEQRPTTVLYCTGTPHDALPLTGEDTARGQTERHSRAQRASQEAVGGSSQLARMEPGAHRHHLCEVGADPGRGRSGVSRRGGSRRSRGADAGAGAQGPLPPPTLAARPPLPFLVGSRPPEALPKTDKQRPLAGGWIRSVSWAAPPPPSSLSWSSSCSDLLTGTIWVFPTS